MLNYQRVTPLVNLTPWNARDSRYRCPLWFFIHVTSSMMSFTNLIYDLSRVISCYFIDKWDITIKSYTDPIPSPIFSIWSQSRFHRFAAARVLPCFPIDLWGFRPTSWSTWIVNTWCTSLPTARQALPCEMWNSHGRSFWSRSTSSSPWFQVKHGEARGKRCENTCKQLGYIRCRRIYVWYIYI